MVVHLQRRKRGRERERERERESERERERVRSECKDCHTDDHYNPHSSVGDHYQIKVARSTGQRVRVCSVT